jgi:hypothetical protein
MSFAVFWSKLARKKKYHFPKAFGANSRNYFFSSLDSAESEDGFKTFTEH